MVLYHLTGVLKTEIVSFTKEVCVLIYRAISPSQLILSLPQIRSPLSHKGNFLLFVTVFSLFD